MATQVAIDDGALAGERRAGGLTVLAPDLAVLRNGIVNVVLLGTPDRWVLVDAGMPGGRGVIEGAAAARFGAGARPRAIWLTHGHFDHVGGLPALAEAWDVPVFAHPDEHPFLDGSRSYPPPEPSLADGLTSALSPLFPRRPSDLRPFLRPLPTDETAPELDGWRWIATPGHTPGHVSFWREETRTLLSGDAVICTAQESAYAVATQRPEIHGPPRYLTADWDAAEASAKRLSTLGAEILVSGHGPALCGPAMRAGLTALADRFVRIARP
jgi:glyoxylase-like metal-dependent hydrolase (beta-lactamase superfamily II)